MTDDFTQAVEAGLQAKADEAHLLHRRVVNGVRAINREWVLLAQSLYEFQKIKGWDTLGYETQEAWLASPEIGIRRGHAFRLVQTYRELVVERGVNLERLTRVDPSKVFEVLPAIRRNRVDTERGLTDCESLAVLDLRERYAGKAGAPLSGKVDDQPIEPDDYMWSQCEACGSKIKVKVA